MTIPVTNINDLKELQNKKMPKQDLDISFNDDAADYQNKLNSFIKECGCNTGTYFLVFSVVLSIALFFFISFILWEKIVLCIVFCFIMAIVGKLIGLYIARVKFFSKLKKFINELEKDTL